MDFSYLVFVVVFSCEATFLLALVCMYVRVEVTKNLRKRLLILAVTIFKDYLIVSVNIFKKYLLVALTIFKYFFLPGRVFNLIWC